MLEKKVYSVFKLIPKEGITVKDLERSIINDKDGEYIFSSFYSFDELPENNILIGRLKCVRDTLYMTER
ncbi:hypothetical protein Cst_c01610 [Thermoclostridium stercorarium subsp. stercorarium DSM 8532]|jgi:hypothetical protein|uniref:Uncharacterized protein n=3 Tax=Thermoclostridium stercorarium TaxID=1510 RepID=L7VKD7_THES1|nr:hypothetical protein [Thermoclostridium stercorarium]AGC67187.1 hypothetical protein Cst_c01610 [Thermoclostridium stercorarium subsp. stercorarium DSM 8532]AGI38266.1 hypothetical protein Clst_0154 [Thermoclostridium stercorarium subsp. stercorarium DSM 8532]ANW97659.1 hypothetical protein CSTERTH_00735 [Thermoclostridium stercorarium subsp. thermolacticum DSM 2910]ANX00220.1 hypothetical protein CSTERLE_00735 [Thermoclostridium stercorarium subsp. leptospartum DSM 9219]